MQHVDPMLRFPVKTLLTKLEKKFKNGALPPTRAEIHSASMALRPPETGRTGDVAGGRQEKP